MILKTTGDIVRRMRHDLLTPIAIPDVFERLAVAYARYASEETQEVVVVTGYELLPDQAYVQGRDAANFDTRWLMSAAADADKRNTGLLLAHLHEHKGKPWFSPADLRTARTVLYSLYRASPQFPQGALLLSMDDAVGLIASPDGFVAIRDVKVVG